MKTIFYYASQLVLFTLLLLLAGCTDDDDNVQPGESDAALETGFVISTQGGAWPDITTYLQWVDDVNLPEISNDNAVELTGSSSVVSFENGVYATPFGAPANLVKYTVPSSDETPAEEQRIVVPGANVFSTIYFQDDNVAYATVAGGISKLIVFNPTEMRITDEVSLTPITSRFPEATRTYYLDILERDGKLFMSVHYENNFVPVNDSVYVAVIDLATSTVEKVLSDGRTGMAFGGQAPNAGMVQNASGDIYVQGLGTTNSGGNSPSGVLRIDAGTTDFAADYFFDLEDATGNICYGVYHTSSGRTFTAQVQDAGDFWEFLTGEPQFKYVEIDLAAATSTGAVPGLPTTYGSRRMIIYETDDQDLLFTIATNDENAVYRMEANDATASKYFNSTGGHVTSITELD